MKKFDIPIYYKSPVISIVKNARKITDPRKKDYTPSVLEFGPVRFLIARHFGFCYGVENAIEIAYKTIEQNNDKRIFLLSEMIHNPEVNRDLKNRGVRFIKEHTGEQLIDWNELNSDDVVIVPAFGTTLEIQQTLKQRGIDPYIYDTTCPFVEKVWNKAEYLGGKGYTIILHGKYNHEETIATFSHSKRNSPTLVIRDLTETRTLSDIILGKISFENFYRLFKGRFSDGFDPLKDLQKIGVVNQTTMLATETQAIAEMLSETMKEKYPEDDISDHFANTSDTLCYATYDNQKATYGLIDAGADFAIVVGGYNSSNTSHIVELCEQKLPVYFISGADKIISASEIFHYDVHTRSELITRNWLKQTPHLQKSSGDVENDTPLPRKSSGDVENHTPLLRKASGDVENHTPLLQKASGDVENHTPLPRNVENHTPLLRRGAGGEVAIILTSGASCPDAILDEVLNKILSFFPDSKSVNEVLHPFLTAD